MELEFTQRQEQTLSPQMIQSMEVLQLGSQELLDYLQTAMQENPVLELQDRYDEGDRGADLPRQLEWLESSDLQNQYYHRQDSEAAADPLRTCGAVDDREERLHDHVLAQLKGLDLPPDTAVCAWFLAGCLDRNGWLEEDLSALAQELGRPEDTLDRALAVIQSLEPSGIGARNLSECLCLQLLRQTPVDSLAVQVAERHLNDLAKNHYGLIARSLGVDQEEVRRACRLIRTLDPRPGARFAPSENPGYITPDIIVASVDGHFEVLPNDRFLPRLHISSYYTRLLQDSGDPQVKDYLTGKIRQAKWMVRAVEQRKDTLLSCAKCIVSLQEDFFHRGPGHLQPLTLADVAQQVGVHESTISRAVNGKYLQCAKGTYPLSYFFSRRLAVGEGNGPTSADGAKALLKSLIEREDSGHPLSDQKLCERMAAQGCALSRRTVAKYREELGIPSAAGRK